MKKETITFRLSPDETQMLLTSLFVRVDRMKRFCVDKSCPLLYNQYVRLSEKLVEKVSDSKFRCLLAHL